jgi:drug/metabolite transporter (DMT)-like permease
MLALAPILTMAAGRWLHGTAVSLTDWVAAALCFAGALLILQPGAPLSLQSASLALLAAASFGAYLILTVALRIDSVWLSLFYTALVPFVALSALMPAVWTPVSLRAGMLLVAIGATGWVGLLLLDKSIRLLMPAHAAVFIYVQVVIDALIIHRLDETATVFGSGIVVCGLICAAMSAHRRQATQGRSAAA